MRQASRQKMSLDTEEEGEDTGRDWSYSPDQTQLRVVRPPQKPATLPPETPQPRRRVLRLPVLQKKMCRAEKEVPGGYQLQTADDQLQKVQRCLEQFTDSSAHQPRPPTGPRRHNLLPPLSTPTKNTLASQAQFTPAPPTKPAPSKKTRFRRAGKVKVVICESRLNEHIDLDLQDLDPLIYPEESLSYCFELLKDKKWDKKIEGLKLIQALAQHHQENLEFRFYEILDAVLDEVENLRSAVASAAIETLKYLYVHLKEKMDKAVQRTGEALLLKVAQAHSKTFLQQQVGVALKAMLLNCDPEPVLRVLVQTGLSHRSATVRNSAAQHLHLLADLVGATQILSAGGTFTETFLSAVNEMAMNPTAEVRTHGITILKNIAQEKNFKEQWMLVVKSKDRPYLEKIMARIARE
ncbi:crescerin-like protein che-12 [Xyrichtys novacula]|uniref:Crescerin-like protein che-12 n=1 Tax=Xyrichtys novacula TaxID=13765 RepID=A0AAV1GZF7_XYRNO|nr:crescerin-like protein che-12 [Xyrichtys novacula]CAJ1078928.1 crescerin-like protein che-12 [Xyrichtys novacula]